MFALISWTSRNGVTLEREEVEVRATRTPTVMNGGKMEPSATVNLQHRKDIWGGKIQSLHGSSVLVRFVMNLTDVKILGTVHCETTYSMPLISIGKYD